jgi:hypothetical protein
MGRRLILSVVAVLVVTSSFADAPSAKAKNSNQLKALSSAWSAQHTIHLDQGKKNITMVYGGQDVSSRPTLNSPIATA